MRENVRATTNAAGRLLYASDRRLKRIAEQTTQRHGDLEIIGMVLILGAILTVALLFLFLPSHP